VSDTVPLLRARGLRIVVGRGPQARVLLDGGALELAAGEAVALVGESGAGKTRLLRVLAGFDRPAAGELLLRDGPARRRSLPRAVQYLFQDTGSSLEPARSARRAVEDGLALQGHEARARADLARWHLERLGIDPGRAEADARSLSAGEQQRVALARALATGARVLLLDEPTSALDVATRAALLADLQHTLGQEGKALLIATHDAAVATRFAHRLLVLEGGRLHAPPWRGEEGPASVPEPARSILLGPRPEVARG
jgi:peptide/nickel transport system ATP-binding protein